MRARLDRRQARGILLLCRAPFGTDFHALPSSVVESLIEAADLRGYHKPRNANGSRARYWHAYLVRTAERAE